MTTSIQINTSEYDEASLGRVNNMEEYENTEMDEIPPDLMVLTKVLCIYVQPVLCFCGIMGHFVSFIIFLSGSMRKMSSNIYLAALSCSSVGFNIVVFLQWLEVVNLRLIHKYGFCQAIVYFAYVFSFLSIWFIVCITIENYIVTFHLSRAVTYCSVIRAKIVVTSMFICSILVYLGQFWTTNVVEVGKGSAFCTEVEEYKVLNRIYIACDIIAAVLIPSILTTGLISAILVRNINTQKNTTNRRLSKKQKSLVRITRVLLAISLTFVILSAPSSANKIRHLIIEIFGHQNYSLKERVMQQLFQILYYLSFSLNFVYYMIWSKNFRKEFKRLFGMKPKPSQRRYFELVNGNGHMTGTFSMNQSENITIFNNVFKNRVYVI